MIGIAGTTGLTPLLAAGQAAAAQGALTGDKVSVYVSGSCCYDGVVIGTGSGSLAGYYLIHFDNPGSQDQYAKAANVVPRRSASAPPAAQGGSAGKQPKTQCVIGTIGGKPVCLTTAPPG